MENILKKLSISLSLLLVLFSCSDDHFINNESSIEANSLETRSISGTTDYYWYGKEKIGINKNDEKKFILFKASDEMTIQLVLANSKIVDQPSIVKLSTKINRKDISKSSESLLWASIIATESLKNKNEIIYDAPYFYTTDGYELGLSHLLYVKLKQKEDFNILSKLAIENNVEIIGNNEYMPLWYTLSCTKESNGNSLEIANKFYETSLFEESYPDLMADIITACVNDTYFNNQWNLLNLGQNNGTESIDIRYCGARSITSGSNNIIVAVIDHGVQLNHPDLNIHSVSYDTETGTSPSVVRGNHGTACAGIIGAISNNNLGVAGIASNSPLMSISNNLITSPDYNQRIADGFNFAWTNGASVISNSWYSPTQQAILTNAIQNAITNGRNGKGCVVVFAAGNFNTNTVVYPANALPDILAVGAMSPCGERKSPSSCDGENWGSNYGVALDIVAPGVFIPTTDRTGSLGYSSGDYYMNFNGTSAACPHVAATAALVLSENPLLTQKQVANIIENTALKIGNYSYSSTYGRSNGIWHQEMGYGLLNTFAAVAKVKSETLSFYNENVSSNLTIGKWYVDASNVTVTNNSHLTFNFGDQITINPPFTVNIGSKLSIYR